MLDETLEKHGLIEEQDEQAPRGNHRTRGLKKTLDLERQRQRETVDEAILDEQFLEMIKEDKEGWLQAINDHLENFFSNANGDNDVLRRKVKHHAQKEKISMAKLKRANEKIEALTMLEEKRKLDILAKASF